MIFGLDWQSWGLLVLISLLNPVVWVLTYVVWDVGDSRDREKRGLPPRRGWFS